LAFRFLKHDIEQKYGKEEARNRIIAITDASKGALRTLATQEGYKTYVIPDDVGGRFSVLTPVGLVPIAFAGFDIRKLVAGAVNMENKTAPDVQFDQNIAEIYAAARNALYNRGKYIEILVNYNPKLHFVAEWWKQLYGESEGKEKKGIFPASVDFSSDLHSMGQYIQEGIRVLFETVISVENVNATQVIELENNDLDGLNYLAGKRIDHINKMAELGTQIAHIQGGVPNIKIEIEAINEFALGELLYFFEKACGISGAILDVNPFDQPGVEAYKKNMFALLGKKGYEHLLKM
jgi:glucose-6-phosphate isomerase